MDQHEFMLMLMQEPCDLAHAIIHVKRIIGILALLSLVTI